ncbi:MAG: MBL fold metallo-hydrolase [Bacteroidia bacterium]|nr:MBL fold metallo-hydrolase [Bacteroidia bacterium]
MPFELTILGSSSALPTSERNPTALVLNVLGRFFLIDCGEGTQIQIRRQKIGFSKIRHIFISHLHGDHYFGLIGLISTFNLLGIKNDLHIYAPSEIKNLIQPQLDLSKERCCLR